MKRSISAALAVCAAFLISCGSKDSADNTPKNAKVVFSVGDVKIEKSGKVSIAQAEMGLADGSMIVTGDKSQCSVLIGSDSYVTIKEKSRMLIDSIVKKASGQESSSVELKVGRIVVNPKKLLKGDEFSVKTPTAIAAVRGTKFVVAQEEGVSAKVSVVEGKISLTPRVEAIETASMNPDESAIAKEIQRTIDDKAIIVEANQSATIDAKSTAALNRSVENAIKDVKASMPAADDKKNESSSSAQITIPDIAVQKIVRNIDISKTLRVDAEAVEDVKELDQAIDEEKNQRTKDDKNTDASITIVTPMKQCVITIDGKRVGQGSVSLRVKSGKPVKIEVKAKDFDKYEESITLDDNESKMIEVALVRSKLRDRLGWSGPVGSGVKGDVIFYNDQIIVSTASGAVVSMTKEGTTVWRSQLAGGLDSAPAISGSRLYAVTKAETLYSLNAVTGKVMWTAKISGSIVFGASPQVVDNSVIVASSGGKIYSFSTDGKEQWMRNVQSNIYSTPSFGSGSVFVAAEDQNLYALSLADGEVQWKVALDGRVVSSSPLVYGDSVIVGTFKGSINAFDAKKGKQSWVVKTGGAIVSSPVIRDDVMYVGSKDGVLYAIDPSGGSIRWKYASDKPITADVAYNGQELYMGSGSTIFALNPKTGSLIWSYGMPEQIVSIIADSDQVYVGSGRSMSALRMDLRDVVK